MRLVLPWLLALAGCAMDNPAFGDAGGTGSETSVDTNTDPSTTTTMTGPDTSDPVCELGPGQPLEIDLGPGFCNTDTPEVFDQFFELTEAVGSKLKGYSCDEGCVNCVDVVATPLSFYPLPLDGIAPVGTCLHVTARRIDLSNADACRFQTVVVEAAIPNQARLPLLIGRNAVDVQLPTVEPGNPLVGFEPQPGPHLTCDCATFPNDCCNGKAPTTFKYDIGTGTPVALGETGVLQTVSDTYVFHALDGFQSGVCGEGTNLAWGLVLQPMG